MKKILATLTMMLAVASFAHAGHSHGEMKLSNEVKYHSVKGVDTELKIGTNEEGELVADLGELGHFHVIKAQNAYISENQSATIAVIGENAILEMKVLLFDRSMYFPDKFEKEMSFHSYNDGYPHLHATFNKNYTEVTLGEDEVFKGEMVLNEETGDRTFVEKDGKFTIILLSKYDDKSKKLPSQPRMGMLNLQAVFTKVK